MRCAARCGQIVAEELHLPPREGLRQASRFLLQRAQARVVALGPEQARQEAFAIAAVRAELGAGDDLDDEEQARPAARSAVREAGSSQEAPSSRDVAPAAPGAGSAA